MLRPALDRSVNRTLESLPAVGAKFDPLFFLSGFGHEHTSDCRT
jgi:hypothetical protein